MINTLSGQFTNQLEGFKAERDEALKEHNELLLSSRARISTLSAERAKLVARLRVVDKVSWLVGGWLVGELVSWVVGWLSHDKLRVWDGHASHARGLRQLVPNLFP